MAERLARVLNVPAAYMYCENEVLAAIILELGTLNKDTRINILQQVKKLKSKQLN